MADRRHREEDLEQLSAYLDGELSEGERAKVERMIAEDPAAAQLLEELRQTSQWLRSLPRAVASADLAIHIADRMEREALLGDAGALGNEPRRPLRWMKPLSLAAGFVLIVTTGWFLWPQMTGKYKAESSVSVVHTPQAAPMDGKRPAESSEETTLALGTPESDRTFGVKTAAKMENRSEPGFLKKERSDVAPLALAPPAASRKQVIEQDADAETVIAAGSAAQSDEAKQRAFSDAGRIAGVMRPTTLPTSRPTTSSPTSAPTTTSAPATSPPTTRSNSGG